MTPKLGVFVSSVQKELEDERLIVQNLINTDSFLGTHCVPVLYEFEPASPETALKGCLDALDGCQVYLLIVGVQYGMPVDGLSITHSEYRRAKERGLPILVFIKGERGLKRDSGTVTLLEEIDADGPKYKRFANVVELQKEVRAALVKLLLDRFGLSPTSDEDLIAEHTIEATSAFESQRLDRIRWQDLDHDVMRRLVAASDGRQLAGLTEPDILSSASMRGLVWREPYSGEHYATAAGIVMLAKDPSAVFPQCRILADAYRGAERERDPRDHEDIRAPMPIAIDRAIAFVDRNTRHPMRILRLDRVRLTEYPVDALREALVNAAAHRLYEDAGRKIILEIFPGRLSILSPGLPPKPITLAGLRSGKYRPCSRNPVLAQCLSFFHRIEERGSGMRRMHDYMLDHGLDPPVLGTDTGYFQVTFVGPGDNVERLRVPDSQIRVTPSVEARLNERQKAILLHALETGLVTRRWCLDRFEVSSDTTGRDLNSLVALGLLVRKGRGRSISYEPPLLPESTDNLPMRD
jgi:predicted HTH transcriptional regulator